MARNASWQCVTFLWHAAWREDVFAPCSRTVYAFLRTVHAMREQNDRNRHAMERLPSIFEHLYALPRRLRACVNSSRYFFGTWSCFAARYIEVSHTARLIQHVEY